KRSRRSNCQPENSKPGPKGILPANQPVNNRQHREKRIENEAGLEAGEKQRNDADCAGENHAAPCRATAPVGKETQREEDIQDRKKWRHSFRAKRMFERDGPVREEIT